MEGIIIFAVLALGQHELHATELQIAEAWRCSLNASREAMNCRNFEVQDGLDITSDFHIEAAILGTANGGVSGRGVGVPQ